MNKLTSLNLNYRDNKACNIGIQELSEAIDKMPLLKHLELNL